MSAAEKEARVAHAKWQEQCLKTSALLDALDAAIDVLDGKSVFIGVDLNDCNRAARKRLEDARKAARQ